MTSTPLRNSDYAKLIIFSILMLPTIFFAGLGVIPVTLLIFSVISAKDNRDFSRIESAVHRCNIYFLLLVIAAVLTQIYMAIKEPDLILFILVPIGVGIIYRKILGSLFLEPLALHKDWVTENGIFPKRAIAKKYEYTGTRFEVVKIDKTPSFSAADELMKWGKLKNDGYITEAEFQEAKKKLLECK